MRQEGLETRIRSVDEWVSSEGTNWRQVGDDYGKWVNFESNHILWVSPISETDYRIHLDHPSHAETWKIVDVDKQVVTELPDIIEFVFSFPPETLNNKLKAPLLAERYYRTVSSATRNALKRDPVGYILACSDGPAHIRCSNLPNLNSLTINPKPSLTQFDMAANVDVGESKWTFTGTDKYPVWEESVTGTQVVIDAESYPKTNTEYKRVLTEMYNPNNSETIPLVYTTAMGLEELSTLIGWFLNEMSGAKLNILPDSSISTIYDKILAV